jgi:hypothetical protein
LRTIKGVRTPFGSNQYIEPGMTPALFFLVLNLFAKIAKTETELQLYGSCFNSVCKKRKIQNVTAAVREFKKV